ncbi:hypothetical protein [Streptococcus ruminantium]|uniref:Uncharacterized protein n=1 Tax=Streptococcus ruminantium TaxID=1917441 RepID=A0A2Z5TQI0_9STRE|nr:hypothetical protein [Streptococcus ruminantium]BBA93426.1 hypothetical protein SR187_9120 [Streptococcus ruminantium]
MKKNKTLIMFLLVLVSSFFCVAPAFIHMNLTSDPLKAIITFIFVTPIYYIISQLLHTTLLFASAIFCKIQLVYFHLGVVAKLGSGVYIRAFFNQIIGFTPSIGIRYKGDKSYQSFFIIYYLLYFLSLIGYYFIFNSIYRNPLWLPVVPFSMVIAIIQKLYEVEHQQLLLLKSQVLTILESKTNSRFSVEDYKAIWQLKSTSELPFIALSYISLIKEYLSEEECRKVEEIEDKRLDDRMYQMGLYGMLDVIKLNLYLYRSCWNIRYKNMLSQLIDDKPNFLLVKKGIYSALNGQQQLSLSLAISEIQFFIDIFKS